jgi:hypothetical protein
MISRFDLMGVRFHDPETAIGMDEIGVDPLGPRSCPGVSCRQTADVTQLLRVRGSPKERNQRIVLRHPSILPATRDGCGLAVVGRWGGNCRWGGKCRPEGVSR